MDITTKIETGSLDCIIGVDKNNTSDSDCEYYGSLAEVNEKFNEVNGKKEMVNHPDHYKGAKFECIEVMIENFGVEATMNFCLLNAFKYTWRNGKKDECVQEAKKAIWYLEKYVELAESTKNN